MFAQQMAARQQLEKMRELPPGRPGGDGRAGYVPLTRRVRAPAAEPRRALASKRARWAGLTRVYESHRV